MVQVLPINYNNEHYKQANFINGNEYTPPPPPPLQHQQQLPIPMPVPMINHLMPPHHPPHHPPHQPPNFFHPPPMPHPPPPPPQAIYPADQTNGQYMDYVATNYHPTMAFMQQGYYSDITVYVPTLQKQYQLHTSILSRSPVLHQRIMEEQSNTMELDLYVLPETFQVMINHLARPMSPQEIMFYATEKPQIAIELLEASEELGLDRLLDALLVALNQNLTHPKVAMTYIEAMEPYQPMEEEEPRRWVELLEEDVVSFMVKGLSTQLEAFSTSVKVSGNVVIGQVNACGYMPSRTPPMRGLMDLARAYAALPQHLMIRCLEHPQLPVQDAIQRAYFARKVLSIVHSNNSFHQRAQTEFMVVIRFEHGVDTIAVVRQTGLKKGCWDPKLYDL
ncbi:uncharacterized protein B0P05DRAFT_545095 [Gilbertella persicaria]|uniref:uncharacterized protein n=1 Tax=Gilbertella persicaria TaxID=101096 RepID=UPI00221E56CC|nr:uncharacterized protein B0P05DRAFT_545095 [Gilbertella persicaria]KAI8076602.1 hypothetical protein B0P05DRAFT_545095 [Gilbertella persicaria]